MNLTKIREWARDYEPAVAATLVAAFLQILLVAGIALGNWPQIIDAVLAFVAVLATVLAGGQIRKRVDSPYTRDGRVYEARVTGYKRGLRERGSVGEPL